MANKKPHLPKSVLDMKFMKKTKERIEKELENTQDHEGLYSSIITDEMRQATGNYISESSFIYCAEMIEGRVSFKGMNPEIERIMDSEIIKEEINGEMEKDVSDDILLKKMNSYHSKKRPSSPSKYDIPKKKKQYVSKPL